MTKLQEEYKLSTERRLVNNEKNFEALFGIVTEIKENHLRHLDMKIDNLDAKIESVKNELMDKMNNIKLGIPPWMAIVFSILSGLIIYILTR